MVLHTSKKGNTCHLCHQCFSFHLLLQFHYDVVHKKKSYTCEKCCNINDECNKNYDDIYSYFYHIVETHECKLNMVLILDLM